MRGEVVFTRAESSEDDDRVLDPFVSFLAHVISGHPERLQVMDADRVQRLRSLTIGVEVDLDMPLSPDDD